MPPALLSDQQSTIFVDRPGGPAEEEEDLRRRQLLYGEPPDTVEQVTKNILELLLDPESPPYVVEQGPESFPECKKFLIEGRDRVGKTAIARKVYEHPEVVRSYKQRSWVNFGGVHKYDYELRQEILDQQQEISKDMESEVWAREKSS